MKSPDHYQSSTYGPIPLSLKGRELLSKLRDVIHELVQEGRSKVKFDEKKAWEPVSEQRGNIAKYMSELEAKVTQAEMEKNGVIHDYQEQGKELRAALSKVRELEGKVRAVGAERDTTQRMLKTQEENTRYWQNIYNARPVGTRLIDASVRELFEQLAKKFHG